jgi:hypothetical protein
MDFYKSCGIITGSYDRVISKVQDPYPVPTASGSGSEGLYDINCTRKKQNLQCNCGNFFIIKQCNNYFCCTVVFTFRKNLMTIQKYMYIKGANQKLSLCS